MAPPRTLALRARMDALGPTPIPLNRPETAPSATKGEFPALMREAIRLSGARRRRAHADLVTVNDTARGLTRTVPVGGPGRRRAKALRNKRAVETCIHRHDGQRCDEDTVDGTVHCARHTRPAPNMLAQVLAYCDEHPHDGPLPEPGWPLMLCRHEDGAITVEGDAPHVLDMSVPLLDADALHGVTWRGGVMTIHTSPQPLRYRPLDRCPADYAVRFQRLGDKRA